MFSRVCNFVVVLISLFLFPITAFATSSSTHYSVTQTLFGVGSQQNLSSSSYSGQASLGDLGIGNYSSSDYQAYAGFNTTSAPFLQFVVTAENIPVTTHAGFAGYLSSSSTATANSTFFVRAWNASGYIVQIVSPAPTNGSHVMTSNATAASSTTGTEQFGMNLEANTSPFTFGAGPVDGVSTIASCTTLHPTQGPAGQYAIVNKYAYHVGDTVASCSQSSTSTIYTASYIFNISNTTPSGQYVFNQILVATGSY